MPDNPAPTINTSKCSGCIRPPPKHELTSRSCGQSMAGRRKDAVYEKRLRNGLKLTTARIAPVRGQVHEENEHRHDKHRPEGYSCKFADRRVDERPKQDQRHRSPD